MNEYAYFGQEVNFNEVFQVQPDDRKINNIHGLEELPFVLQKKEELTFVVYDLMNVNIWTTYEQKLIQVRVALSVPQ